MTGTVQSERETNQSEKHKEKYLDEKILFVVAQMRHLPHPESHFEKNDD